MKIKPSHDAPVWHLLWSNQAAALSVVTMIQGALPYWEGIIPDRYFMIAGAILSTLVLILRNIEQPKVRAKLESKRAR